MDTINLLAFFVAIGVSIVLAVIALILALDERAKIDKRFKEMTEEVERLRDDLIMRRVDLAASGTVLKMAHEGKDITTVNWPVEKPKKEE